MEEKGSYICRLCRYLLVTIYLLNFAGLQMALNEPDKKTGCLPVVPEVLCMWVSICGCVNQFDS